MQIHQKVPSSRSAIAVDRGIDVEIHHAEQ
jgi:hypothetical protein